MNNISYSKPLTAEALGPSDVIGNVTCGTVLQYVQGVWTPVGGSAHRPPL